MHRIVLSAALALGLFGSFALAQQAPTPESGLPAHQHHAHNPQRQVKHLGKRLGLSADQTARLQPILADRDQKMAQLRSSSLSPQQRHQQMHAIKQGTYEKLSSVLTPDQLQQMKAMHHHHGHRPGDVPPATPQAGL